MYMHHGDCKTTSVRPCGGVAIATTLSDTPYWLFIAWAYPQTMVPICFCRTLPMTAMVGPEQAALVEQRLAART